MAVTDWPNTYGYNLFLYPWDEWLRGPWNLFIEHAHRLFAAAVGLVCIAFVFVVWRFERRRWVRWAALGALALVIAQGVLGGMRVLFDERTLALIHGCIGPLFFTHCVLLATWTSRRWIEAADGDRTTRGPGIAAIALTVALLAYVQLVVGAQLRHVGSSISPATFRAFVFLHLIGAAALLAAATFLAVRTWIESGEPWLRRPAAWLAALVILQILLGGATWVVNYGWPAWFGDYPWAAGLLVGGDGALDAKGQLQSNITTAHVAFGSLILGIAAMIAVRACRICNRGSTLSMQTLTYTGVPA
jgi:cytochrome c oxidase assembly protein subunit 15